MINLFIACVIVLLIWVAVQAVLVHLEEKKLKAKLKKAEPAKIIVLHDKRVLEVKEVFS
jgi:hypothetical protein